MQSWKLIALRLVISFLVGATVTWTALSAGQTEAERSIKDGPIVTRQYLILITNDIEVYRLKKHVLPHSLSQLSTGKGDGDYTPYLDGWGNPFVYTVKGTHYLVESYGRDGRPGGIGWDTDISSDNPHPANTGPTFHQFLTDHATQEMVQWAYVSGILACLLCLFTFRPKTFTWQSTLSLVIQVAATLVAATGIAMFITVLHAPMGH